MAIELTRFSQKAGPYDKLRDLTRSNQKSKTPFGRAGFLVGCEINLNLQHFSTLIKLNGAYRVYFNILFKCFCNTGQFKQTCFLAAQDFNTLPL